MRGCSRPTIAAWRTSGGSVGPSTNVAAVDEAHAAEHLARRPPAELAVEEGLGLRPVRPERRDVAQGAWSEARAAARRRRLGERGPPNTATSPSALVGCSMWGAFRKVAIPANGISPLPIYFTPFADLCATSAMHSSTRSKPNENSSGGWLSAGVGRRVARRLVLWHHAPAFHRVDDLAREFWAASCESLSSTNSTHI